VITDPPEAILAGFLLGKIENGELQAIKNPIALNLKRRDYWAPQNGDIKEKQWH
jgi:hypothetical protein